MPLKKVYEMWNKSDWGLLPQLDDPGEFYTARSGDGDDAAVWRTIPEGVETWRVRFTDDASLVGKICNEDGEICGVLAGGN